MIFFLFAFSGKDKAFRTALKNTFGFSPGNLLLYKQAFRHNSAAEEIKSGVRNNNERLEYLGDAILNAIIADFVFKKFPYQDEGFLTKLRSKIVSRDHLNRLSRKMGLDRFIEKSEDPGLQRSSILGNAFEALVGAIFLDKGFLFTRHFIIGNILKFHVDVEKIEATESDFKSRLIEWAQREKKEIAFRLLQTGMRGNEKQFTVAVEAGHEIIAHAQHFSKRKAEQRAAEIACSYLGIA